MGISKDIIDRMLLLANEVEAGHLMKFFKTGKGEYGEGDRFLGLRVPVTRAIVKEHRREVEIDDVRELTESAFHEIRLAGLLLLIEIYQRAKKRKNLDEQKSVVDFYLSVIDRGNNWDLVDLVAPKILGDWLVANRDERHLLDGLADMDGQLWHQRVAIVATWTLIAHGEYDDTLRIAYRLLNHPHDLIHKATGWMLREMGKRGGKAQLVEFLDLHASAMPRTMLRYALEHFGERDRKYYMSLEGVS